jgi:hypothetical protein
LIPWHRAKKGSTHRAAAIVTTIPGNDTEGIFTGAKAWRRKIAFLFESAEKKIEKNKLVFQVSTVRGEKNTSFERFDSMI